MLLRKTLNILIKLLCIAALVAAALFCYDTLKDNQAARRNMQEVFDSELRPLTNRQRELELELQSLDREYTRIITGLATVQIVATDPGRWVSQYLQPAMDDADMTGVIAVNRQAMPDGEEMLSSNQVKELTAKGWELIYGYDADDFSIRFEAAEQQLARWKQEYQWRYGTSQEVRERMIKEEREKRTELLTNAFKSWKKEVSDTAAALGLDLSNAIYFPKNKYKREYDGFLRDAGFEMVIHHGEEDRVVLADLAENRIWFPGSIPWASSGLDKQLEKLLENGANLTLTVSQPGDNSQDQFVTESFPNLLKTLAEYRSDGVLEVCTFAQMASFQMRTVIDRSAKENEARRQAIQEELDQINAQIESVYAEHGMKRG